MTRIRVWLTRVWPWLLAALLLVLCGIFVGWRLATLLGVGLAGGGVVKRLGDAQAEREREGKRLEQRREDLEHRAGETDVMINSYYKQKGGPRQ